MSRPRAQVESPPRGPTPRGAARDALTAARDGLKERAIARGVEFIYAVAREPAHFAAHGSDLLSCFYFIAATSKDRRLRRRTREMGRERAREWRRTHPTLPADPDTDTVLDFVHGAYAADRLGVRDPALKEQLRSVAPSHGAHDYLSFDPRVEPPPRDVPAECDCGEWNARGRKRCRVCGRRLSMLSRYLVWYDALMRTYSAARYGVSLGASYADVLRWLPSMRPYPEREGGAHPDFYDAVYAVTHLVYTLNDYSVYNLSPRWLPLEFSFVKASMKDALAAEDGEMVGEILDSLRAFGLTDAHPLVRRGVAYLLGTQNEDGSWGEADDSYIYGRYHPTWTAVDGLREYAWRGERLSFPPLMPLLSRRASARARSKRTPADEPRRTAAAAG